MREGVHRVGVGVGGGVQPVHVVGVRVYGRVAMPMVVTGAVGGGVGVLCPRGRLVVGEGGRLQVVDGEAVVQAGREALHGGGVEGAGGRGRARGCCSLAAPALGTPWRCEGLGASFGRCRSVLGRHSSGSPVTGARRLVGAAPWGRPRRPPLP